VAKHFIFGAPNCSQQYEELMEELEGNGPIAADKPNGENEHTRQSTTGLLKTMGSTAADQPNADEGQPQSITAFSDLDKPADENDEHQLEDSPPPEKKIVRDAIVTTLTGLGVAKKKKGGAKTALGAFSEIFATELSEKAVFEEKKLKLETEKFDHLKQESDRKLQLQLEKVGQCTYDLHFIQTRFSFESG
jgi:hypothetical protein